MCMRELNSMCCIRRGPRYRLAWISRELVGDDLIVPVIARSAVLCIWVIFFAVPMAPRTGVPVVLLCVGWSQTLAA